MDLLSGCENFIQRDNRGSLNNESIIIYPMSLESKRWTLHRNQGHVRMIGSFWR